MKYRTRDRVYESMEDTSELPIPDLLPIEPFEPEQMPHEGKKKKPSEPGNHPLLHLFRVIFPISAWILLLFQQTDVYVFPFGFFISRSVMNYANSMFHIVSMLYGFHTKAGRGTVYELCCGVLATEMNLLFYYQQVQPLGALGVLLLYGLGWLLLCRKGIPDFKVWDKHGCLPRNIMRDTVESSTNCDVEHVVKRRYAVMAAALLLAVPSLLTVTVYGMDGALGRSSAHAVIDPTAENQMLPNLSTIHLLNDDEWERLSPQEKLDVLQIVADIETHHMSISPVKLVNAHLQEHTLGQYAHDRRTAYIDLAQHEGENNWAYLDTVLHECRHAFQHDCVDSLDWSSPQMQESPYFAAAKAWRNEMRHGEEGSYQDYWNRSMEKDARQYAEDGLDVYYQYLHLSTLPTR